MGPSFPFHPSHFIFSHSSQIAPRVQKINRSTKDLVFTQMKGRMRKEEAERLARLGRDRMKATLEQNEEEEGTKMEIEPKNERKEIVSISSGCSIKWISFNIKQLERM